MKKLITLLFISSIGLQAQGDITVFAAASTTDVMKELAAEFEKNGGERVRFNFAGSGALARQINAGAPAELFISANIKWMDYLENQQVLLPNSRTHLAQNNLVLVAPPDSPLTFANWPKQLNGRLAIGDPKSVPAGAYAKIALESLNLFNALQPRLITGKDVRTVLLYVARGEVEAGIVYSTDAQSTDRVKVIGTFPAESHPPIIYPGACLKDSSDSAQAFLQFISSPTSRPIWEKQGFRPSQQVTK